MIDGLIRWALDHRMLVLLLAFGVLIGGISQVQKMPVDVFPDLTAPTVTVVTEAHGMAPEEVERQVTFPIESSMLGASGVRRVRSASSVGLSVVWVEFDWGADIYRARQIVSEKLQLTAASLPPEVEPPALTPISSIMGEVLFIGLTSGRRPPAELRRLADWQLRRRLLAISGVAQVIPIGGDVEQVQVRLRPVDLARHGVAVQEVLDAVRASHENSSAGFLVEGGQEHLIYTWGQIGALEDVALAVVRDREGAPVRVMDVADVVLGHALARGDASINGARGVVLGVQKQPGVNTLALTARLDAALDDIKRGLPEGVYLQRRLLRQADFIEASVTNVRHALRDGALLVVLIVGLFLMSGRATLITAVTIPLSLLVAALALDAAGGTLNTMTLGGMAIAVGALVDDAIIDVENVTRRLRERLGGEVGVTQIVFEASSEIRGSIVFATLIIALVFAPLLVLDGVEGRLLRPLGVAYVVALGASLLVALTVTPVLCAWWLPSSGAVRRGQEPALVRVLCRAYEAVLERVVRRWGVLMIGALVASALAAGVVARAGRAFLPEFNEGALTISVVTLTGTSLDASNQLAGLVEQRLAVHPSVASVARRTGRAELDEHAQGVHASELDVRLSEAGLRTPGVRAQLRAAIGQVPGANVVIGQPISHRIDHMLSGTRANIAIKVFGPDLLELQRLAGLARAEIAQVPGAVDLAVEEQANLPMVAVRLDRAALARHGLRVHDVAEVVEVALGGKVVARARLEGRPIDLAVRYPDASREDIERIRQLPVRTHAGAWVPLEALAWVGRDRGPSQIGREDGQRKLVIMCNVTEGADLGGVVAAIQQRISARVPLPQGYRVAYGGQFEAAQEATRRLTWLLMVVVVGIFALLYGALGGARDALLVMLNLPLALIGGVGGVVVTGGVLSVASIIGLITLLGIATRNGIMLVTHIQHLTDQEGLAPERAIIQGASERLAPILMTALASGLGLLPLALASGEPGSEIQAPMAIVILCGLTTATTLNMLVVPAMVWRFGASRVVAEGGEVTP